MLINNGQPQPDPHALELISYRVLGKKYSQWRSIITEATGESDTLFRLTLLKFGIKIETDLDPFLYIIQDTGQMREFREEGILNPTFLQLLLSSKIVSLSEQDALDQMAAWLEANRVKPE